MQKRIMIFIGAALVALFAVSFAAAESDAERISALEEQRQTLREKVEAGKADGTITPYVIPAIEPEKVGVVGLPLTTESGSLTLVGASVNASGELELSLKIENTTAEDQTVYGSDFSVLDAEGWVQDSLITPEDVRFGGNVETGGTMEGVLRYQLNGRPPFRVYFADNVYYNQLYVWNVMEVEGIDIEQGPIPGSDEARIADLEAEISALWLEAAGTVAAADPTVIHVMNEAVPTTVGQIQLTRGYVRSDQVLELSFRVVNTTENVVTVDDFDIAVRDGNGMLLDAYYDCDNALDANIFPGEMVQGKACFEDFVQPPLRVYYVVDAHNAELVTWEIK